MLADNNLFHDKTKSLTVFGIHPEIMKTKCIYYNDEKQSFADIILAEGVDVYVDPSSSEESTPDPFSYTHAVERSNNSMSETCGKWLIVIEKKSEHKAIKLVQDMFHRYVKDSELYEKYLHENDEFAKGFRIGGVSESAILNNYGENIQGSLQRSPEEIKTNKKFKRQNRKAFKKVKIECDFQEIFGPTSTTSTQLHNGDSPTASLSTTTTLSRSQRRLVQQFPYTPRTSNRASGENTQSFGRGGGSDSYRQVVNSSLGTATMITNSSSQLLVPPLSGQFADSNEIPTLRPDNIIDISTFKAEMEERMHNMKTDFSHLEQKLEESVKNLYEVQTVMKDTFMSMFEEQSGKISNLIQTVTMQSDQLSALSNNLSLLMQHMKVPQPTTEAVDMDHELPAFHKPGMTPEKIKGVKRAQDDLTPKRDLFDAKETKNGVAKNDCPKYE